MKFRTRFNGELVLTKKDISNRRPVKHAEVISFSAKTMSHFGDCLKEHVKAKRLVPLDNEARVFVGWQPLTADDLEKPKHVPPVSSPLPSPTPDSSSDNTPPGDAEDKGASGEGAETSTTETPVTEPEEAPPARRKR